MTATIQQGLAPTRVVLDNGVVVIAKAASTTPAVTIHAAFHAGSAYDPVGLPGVAYAVSRVIDRGTERRRAEVIAEELDSHGVALTINVTRHLLTLSCTCLAEDFEAMVDLIGDVGMRPTFPDAELATRRGEVITSIRQDEDNPAVMAVEGLLGLLYPDGHPYGRRSKGTTGTVEAIDRLTLERFHSARFAPSAFLLVVVGDVEPSRVVDIADRVFGRWEAPLPNRIVLPAVTGPATRRRLVLPMMNKAQTDIAYGFTTIVRSDPSYYAFWIMNHALGQYALGGRLGDSIRERQGMAYYVFSSFDANVAEGPLIIRAGVNPANVDRAIRSIDEEIANAGGGALTEREIAESRQYLTGSLPRTLETNAGIAGFLQAAEFFGLGLDYDVRLPGLLQAVTPDQVHEAARRVLSAERATVVIAGPYGGDNPH